MTGVCLSQRYIHLTKLVSGSWEVKAYGSKSCFPIGGVSDKKEASVSQKNYRSSFSATVLVDTDPITHASDCPSRPQTSQRFTTVLLYFHRILQVKMGSIEAPKFVFGNAGLLSRAPFAHFRTW